jgi:nicotinate-nucleotide--dimethylbenzimidazole phosphoribosyltransferase
MSAWLAATIVPPDEKFAQLAREHQAQLTKPHGSLGQLETLAIQLSAMQQTLTPAVEKIFVSIFAADHGIAAEGVSAFPQAVTVEMVKNFVAGGAAVNVLSRYLQADFEVVDVGLLQTLSLTAVRMDKTACGTANFCQQPAMTNTQLHHALNAGKAAVQRAMDKQVQLFIGGEMGIANTSSATAIACAILGKKAVALTGAGTGLDSQAIVNKAKIIQMALDKHQPLLTDSFAILQTLGGFEIAALVGAYLFAASQQLPVLIDGFIATVAALVAIKINPPAQAWFIYAHHSNEQGHTLILQALNVQPLLALSLRLGEASGALTAVPLLQMACRLQAQMATFAQAHITTT